MWSTQLNACKKYQLFSIVLYFCRCGYTGCRTSWVSWYSGASQSPSVPYVSRVAPHPTPTGWHSTPWHNLYTGSSSCSLLWLHYYQGEFITDRSKYMTHPWLTGERFKTHLSPTQTFLLAYHTNLYYHCITTKESCLLTGVDFRTLSLTATRKPIHWLIIILYNYYHRIIVGTVCGQCRGVSSPARYWQHARRTRPSIPAMTSSMQRGPAIPAQRPCSAGRENSPMWRRWKTLRGTLLCHRTISPTHMRRNRSKQIATICTATDGNR